MKKNNTNSKKKGIDNSFHLILPLKVTFIRCRLRTPEKDKSEHEDNRSLSRGITS